MTTLQKILQIAQKGMKYGALAVAAVTQVQAEVGASSGDAGLQATKKQLAVSYVLAAAHAGESVSIPQIQEIAAAVDFAASTAKALGFLGKIALPSAVVAVPAAVPAS